MSRTLDAHLVPWVSPRYAFAARLQARLGAGMLSSLLTIALVWHARARQRRQLADLEPHQLADVGLARVDALAEAQKPFWVD